MGGLLPLRLKDTNAGISLRCHNGSVMQSLKRTDAMVYHVEWLTGETINFKCTQMFLAVDSSTIRSTYTVEQFRYLVSRVVCVPATLLAIVFQPLKQRNGRHVHSSMDAMTDTTACSDEDTVTCVAVETPISIQVHVAVVVTEEFQVYARRCVCPTGRCAICFSDLSLGGHHILDYGEYGTYEWGEAHHDEEIAGDVAWSGENEFCHMCYATGAFIYHLMAEHSLRRRRGIEALGKAARWIRTLDMASDIVSECDSA